MEIKIIQKNEKPLLLRTEAAGEIYFEGKTPSKEEVKSLVVKELKSEQLLTLVKRIRPYFGARKAGITAYIYANKEAMEKIEPGKQGKNQEKEEGKEEPKEKPKEEDKKPKKSEEPSKEEKKEEPKKQEKEKHKKEEKK